MPVQMLENSTSNYLVTHSGNQPSSFSLHIAGKVYVSAFSIFIVYLFKTNKIEQVRFFLKANKN